MTMVLIQEDVLLMSEVPDRWNVSTEAYSYQHYMPNDSLGNVSSLELVHPTDKKSCVVFLFIFFTLFVGMLCILGFIGNTVSIVVLHKDRGGRVHAALFLLKALAIADNCVLLMSFICLCIVFGLLPMANAHDLRKTMIPYIVTYVQPFANMAHTATVWMTVLLAVNRYVAICRPFDAHRIVSFGKTKIQVAVVFAFAVTLNLPRFFQYRVLFRENATTPSAVATFMGIRTTFGVVYTTWLYTVIVFILPLVLLILLNGRLIVELKRMRTRRGSLQDERKSEENITLVMLVIIIVFILCICPERVTSIVRQFTTAYPKCTLWYYFDCVSQVLVVINSSTNFLVYYVFRRRFRQILIQRLCYPRCCPSRVEEYALNGQADNRHAVTLLSTTDQAVISAKPTVTDKSQTVL